MALKPRMLCLGIESTAHTFGIAVASESGEILSDVRAVYKPPTGSGIHPREAAQHHVQIAPKILQEALRKASVRAEEVNAVAFSMGPGLGPVLRVGATVARALSLHLKKPLIPVHHAIGHIEIAALTTGLRDPLTVIVSGGHTAIVAFSNGYWRVFGETEDITLGNLLDALARKLGYPSPGGEKIEELAEKGSKYIDLPYTVKGNDVAYSGLLTAAVKKLKEGAEVEDVCFSVQEIAFAMLVEATERSLAHLEKKELMLTGGVAANRRLQAMFKEISREHNAVFKVVDRRFTADCGAQIAWTGILAYKAGVILNVSESAVKPRWRIDQVPIPWRGDGICV
jgi:N6-L-threonylcarbamoyladenine synthase